MSNEKDFIVGMPLYPNCTLMDFAGSTQVFAAAGFKVIWLASTKDILTSEGVTVKRNYDFKSHPEIDLLFVPGGDSDGVAGAMGSEDLIEFVQKAAATAQWKGSVCTGAFVLAAAGVLTNCEATTYWSQIPTLQKLAAKLHLIVNDHYYPRSILDEKQCLFTGGGISSAIDLALQLVLQLKGLEDAQATQLFMQYQPMPPVDSGMPAVAPPFIVAQQMAGGEAYAKILEPEIKKILARK